MARCVALTCHGPLGEQELPTEEWKNDHPGWFYLANFDPYETLKVRPSFNPKTDLELRRELDVGSGSFANTIARAAFAAARQEKSGASRCDGKMNTFTVLQSYCKQTQMQPREFRKLANASANGHMTAMGFASDNGGRVFAPTINPLISVEGVYHGPLFDVPVDLQNQVLQALTNNLQDSNSYCMVKLTNADNNETTCLAVSNKLPHWAQRPDGGKIVVVEGSNENTRGMKAAAQKLPLRSAPHSSVLSSGDIISPFDSFGHPIQPRL